MVKTKKKVKVKDFQHTTRLKPILKPARKLELGMIEARCSYEPDPDTPKSMAMTYPGPSVIEGGRKIGEIDVDIGVRGLRFFMGEDAKYIYNVDTLAIWKAVKEQHDRYLADKELGDSRRKAQQAYSEMPQEIKRHYPYREEAIQGCYRELEKGHCKYAWYVKVEWDALWHEWKLWEGGKLWHMLRLSEVPPGARGKKKRSKVDRDTKNGGMGHYP